MGLNDDALCRLPMYEYEPGDGSVDEDATTCQICLENYNRGDTLMRLPCMHCFHWGCIASWLERSRKCPTCKDDVETGLSNAPGFLSPKGAGLGLGLE